MPQFWTNTAGNVLVDITGKPILCAICPCGGIGCEFCSSGVGPPQFGVTISGITNDVCANCDPEFNNTFICDFDSVLGDACKWKYTFPGESALCTGLYPGVQAAFVSLWIGYGNDAPWDRHGASGQYWAIVEINAGQNSGTGLHFRHLFGGSKPDCESISSQALSVHEGLFPPAVFDYYCSRGSAACAISSL